jgi:hypothetical protein
LPSRFEESGSRWAWRVRIGLLLGIAAVAVFIWIGRHPKPAAPAQPVPAVTPAGPQAPAQEKTGEDEEVRVRITPPPAG